MATVQSTAAPSVAVATPPLAHPAELFLVCGGLGFFAVVGGSIFFCRPKLS
jgi:hypothetical protein